MPELRRHAGDAKVGGKITHKDAVIHALRHTCAIRLLELTDNLKLVQEWMGHSTITTTGDMYTHIAGKRFVAAALELTAARKASVAGNG